MKVFLNILGIVVVLGLIVLISWDRKNIRWKAVGKAIIAQFIIAILLVKIGVVASQQLRTITSGRKVSITCSTPSKYTVSPARYSVFPSLCNT